jgi:hypothetical protein
MASIFSENLDCPWVTYIPIQRLPAPLFPTLRRLGRQADLSATSNVFYTLCPYDHLWLGHSSYGREKRQIMTLPVAQLPIPLPSLRDGRQGRRLRQYTASWKDTRLIPDRVTEFPNWPNSSSLTVVMGSTLPLREMSTRTLPEVKVRPARKTDKHTAIC